MAQKWTEETLDLIVLLKETDHKMEEETEVHSEEIEARLEAVDLEEETEAHPEIQETQQLSLVKMIKMQRKVLLEPSKEKKWPFDLNNRLIYLDSTNLMILYSALTN